MYSTARYTLVDCSQLQSPSPISKSSLQLVHPRKIVSISLLFATTHRSPNGFRRIRIISGRQISSHSSAASSSNNYAFDCDSTHNDFVLPPGKLQFRNVTWIGIATITSKVLGLVREIVIASVFGIGLVATAFRYASVLPGFAASVLGGVNGPIHITMTATLSKLPQDRQEKLFKHANTVMILVGGLVAALVFIFSKSIIHVYAPGLWTSTEGQITGRIAIQQLKIMSSCIVFAGPVGLGFGYLSAKGENVFPAISPAFSSLLLIASCLFYSFSRKSDALSSGGVLLSCGASLGVVVQWIIQVALLRGAWHEVISASWIDGFRSRDLCELFSVLVPAIFNSGLAQIASFTDICFASHFPGAAAGLSYAFLLVMAPLGLLSSIVILPILPMLSRLIKVILLPFLSVMSSLANPTIRVLFERYAFDSSASALVSSLYLFYSLGSPFLILRELLVAVFYAFGDGLRPFLVSIGAIALNALLDWFFVYRLNSGVQGLALATSLTAALSLVTLFHLLQRKVGGLFHLPELIGPGLLLCFCCVISSSVTSISYEMISKFLLSEYITRLPRIQELYCIVSAAALGIIGFFAPLLLYYFCRYKWERNNLNIDEIQG
nr:probable lipid II flippase MurJ isoform X2 [Nicotiana tomentosiformis]